MILRGLLDGLKLSLAMWTPSEDLTAFDMAKDRPPLLHDLSEHFSRRSLATPPGLGALLEALG